MQCKFKKTDGVVCKAFSLTGSDYCYWHSPDIDENKKRNARSKGGKLNQHIPVSNREAKPINLKNVQDVVELLSETINAVRAELHATDSLTSKIKIANSIAFLSGHIINAMEKSDLQKRLEEIEEHVQQMNKGRYH